jgi:hypothetical protein
MVPVQALRLQISIEQAVRDFWDAHARAVFQPTLT